MAIAATPLTYGHDASLARFFVAAYQRMVESGALTSEDKVELLENYVVLKMPHNPPHDSTIQRMLRPLLRRLPGGWDLRVQSVITLSDSEPEPDFAIVRGSSADYETRHPFAADVGLVIEVADTSLARSARQRPDLRQCGDPRLLDGEPIGPADRSLSSTVPVGSRGRVHSTPILPRWRRRTYHARWRHSGSRRCSGVARLTAHER
jgi:hypothetical protein